MTITAMYVTEAQLDEISSAFLSSKYCTLCQSLGVLGNQGTMILAARDGNYQKALGQVLRLWKERTGGSRSRLHAALKDAGAGELIKE